MDEVAPYRRAAQQLRKLGVGEQPVGIPRCPVGIVAVRDPKDDVVRLGGLVQEIGDAGVVRHAPILSGQF